MRDYKYLHEIGKVNFYGASPQADISMERSDLLLLGDPTSSLEIGYLVIAEEDNEEPVKGFKVLGIVEDTNLLWDFVDQIADATDHVLLNDNDRLFICERLDNT